MTVLAMFPLGSVLVPSSALPLHVFEPRYRELMRDCLAGSREFGVVLIERGSEVGGQDVRSSIGTVAHILDAVELPDGRWAVGAVGVRRVRVRTWLADDPYPRADIEDWPDPAPQPGCDLLASRAATSLRQALALATEAGDATAPSTFELSDDVGLASHQMVALAPIGPFDRQALLCAPSPDARLRDLDVLLRDAIDVLRFRLAQA